VSLNFFSLKRVPISRGKGQEWYRKSLELRCSQVASNRRETLCCRTHSTQSCRGGAGPVACSRDEWIGQSATNRSMRSDKCNQSWFYRWAAWSLASDSNISIRMAWATLSGTASPPVLSPQLPATAWSSVERRYWCASLSGSRLSTLWSLESVSSDIQQRTTLHEGEMQSATGAATGAVRKSCCAKIESSNVNLKRNWEWKLINWSANSNSTGRPTARRPVSWWCGTATPTLCSHWFCAHFSHEVLLLHCLYLEKVATGGIWECGTPSITKLAHRRVAGY